jgi:hypothetical protein
MSRPVISYEHKNAIRALKLKYPDMSYRDLAKEFEPIIGRRIVPSAVKQILDDKSTYDTKAMAKIESRLVEIEEARTKTIASMIASMSQNRTEAMAKLTKMVNNMTDHPENIGFREAVQGLSELTKVDQTVKGLPTEFHRVVHTLDDRAIDFLISLKPNGVIDGEIIEGKFEPTGESGDREPVGEKPGGVVETGGGGENEAVKGGEAEILYPQREAGEVYPSQELYQDVPGSQQDGEKHNDNY